MSLNLYVKATQWVKPLRGKPYRATAHFDLWQTPTRVTEKALDGDPVAEYEKWVKTLGNDDGDDHVSELKLWLRERISEGWKIEWYTV